MPIKTRLKRPKANLSDGKLPILIEMWPIDKPVDYPKNARKWSQKAIDKVATSLREFGFRQPIVVDSEAVIVIGHLRRRAARDAGFTEVPVHVAADLSPAQTRQLRLMDNRSHDEAEWDLDILAEEMKELAALDLDLSLTGFDKAEFVSFMAGAGLTDPDEVPEAPAVPVTRPGDLWLMGEHRVLCGDATSVDAVRRLMNGQRAQLVATDPPYLVDYTGGDHPESWSNKGTAKRNKDWSDTYREVDTCPEDFFCAFMKAAIAGAATPNAAWYVWHAFKRQKELQQAMEKSGFLVHSQIIWFKSRPVLTRSHFMWAHEAALYGWQQGNTPEVKPPGGATSVWQIDSKIEDGATGIHPTQKPVETVTRCIEYSSRAGALLYEPFSGSGTAFIAAQKTSRRCSGMEMSCPYVDVIVTRWQNFTGKEATLEGDSRTFAQIGAERKS